MGQYLSIETVYALFNSAMDAGCRPEVREDGRAYRRKIRWNVAGRCQNPRIVSFWSSHHVSTKKGVPLGVDLETRCRKCRWCLMKRRNEWASAAVNEVRAAPRTWFLTLTMSPEAHHRAQCALRVAVANYDSLPPDKRFRAMLALLRPSTMARRDRCAVDRSDEAPFSYSRALTLFIKRVRKNSKAKLRYLLVAEAHKSGLPHFHMLLHEMDDPVRKAVIKAAWPYGFSKVSLCDGDSGAVYLCKYLAKDASTRVRASFKYGNRIKTHEMHSDSVPIETPQNNNTSTEPFSSREVSSESVVYEWPDEIQERFSETSLTRTVTSGSPAWDETSGNRLDPFQVEPFTQP